MKKRIILTLGFTFFLIFTVLGNSGSWSPPPPGGDTYSHTGAVVRGEKSGSEYTYTYQVGPPAGYSFATISGGNIVNGSAVAIKKTTETECQITMNGTLSGGGGGGGGGGGVLKWHATATGKADFYIVSSPDPAIVAVGNTATFTAYESNSTTPISVSWSIKKQGGSQVQSSSGTSITSLTSLAADNYTVTATNSDGDTADASLKIVAVVSISGLAELYCSDTNCSEVVTAELTNGADLPSGTSITWSGDATFSNISGKTATAKFSGHIGKNKKITAKIGTQTPIESSTYVVVDATSITGKTDVAYSYKYINPAPNWGLTEASDPEADITAYFSHTNHTWKCKVTSSSCEIKQGSRLLPGVSEATVGACTTETIYRKMRTDLVARGNTSPCEWYMLSAVVAHEKVHSDLWESGNNALFTTFKNTVELLEVPYVDAKTESSTQAKAALLNLKSYTSAFKSYIDDGNTYWGNTVDHPAVDSATDSAEDAVTGNMIKAIDAKASIEKWTL